MFNIDQTQQAEFRAYIRHITVLEKEDFGPAILAVVDFIWKELNADTIRIDLYHYKENEESVAKANIDIKEALVMKKQGFKWKTLINDMSGNRYQIMQMNKPKDFVFDEKALVLRKLKPKQEPITIKGGLMMRLFKDDVDEVPNVDYKEQLIEIPYCYMSAFMQLKTSKEIGSLSELNTEYQNELVNEVDMIPDSLQLQGVRATMSSDKQVVLKEAVDQNVDISDPSFTHKVDEYLCSVLSSVIRLPPFTY